MALSVPCIVAGQNTGDKLFFFYEASPASNFKKIAGGSNRAELWEISVGTPPINLGLRLKWIHSIYGKATTLELGGLENELAALSSTLYDIQYGQIFILSFNNKKWSLLGAPRLQIRSDFGKNQLKNGIFSNAILLANYNPDGKQQLTWSFGIAYTNDFNNNQFIPVAGLTYKNNKYLIEVTYPRVNLLFKPKKHIEWGITGAVTGGIFKTGDIKLSNENIASFTRIINVSVGHTFNYLLNNRLIINTCIGYLPVRNYDLLDVAYRPFQSTNTDLKPTAFVRTGISVRF